MTDHLRQSGRSLGDYLQDPEYAQHLSWNDLEDVAQQLLEKYDYADERADDAIIVIHKLREAVAFLRACDRSGEHGADHPVVVQALDLATRWTAGERGLMEGLGDG